MKKENLNLQSGNKGVLVTIDSVFAVFLVILIIASQSALLRNKEDPLQKLQMQYTIQDSLIVLDHLDFLDDINIDSIKANLSNSDNIKLEITCDNAGVIDDGVTLQQNKLIVSGKYYFIKSNDTIDDRCQIQYWVIR